MNTLPRTGVPRIVGGPEGARLEAQLESLLGTLSAFIDMNQDDHTPKFKDLRLSLMASQVHVENCLGVRKSTADRVLDMFDERASSPRDIALALGITETHARRILSTNWPGWRESVQDELHHKKRLVTRDLKWGIDHDEICRRYNLTGGELQKIKYWDEQENV